MNIERANIAIASSYEAPYGGNFIKMLVALGKKLQNNYKCQIYLVFPEQAEKEWLKMLKQDFCVIYTKKPYNKSTNDFIKLFREKNINLVHTHFESYDIPVAKAVKKVNKGIKMVWHLHDHISVHKKNVSYPFFRTLKTHFTFMLHFGYYGRKAFFVPVSMEVGNIENHYRNHIFTLPKENLTIEQLNSIKLIRGQMVINGIDLSRIGKRKPSKTQLIENRFLTFGGHTILKGIPTILDAAEFLQQSGYNFKIGITKGIGTEDYVNNRYANKLPDWLNLLEQTDNINSLFADYSCFISASTKETMSMAIAEASIYGLPVIQSDIPGTWWNSQNPSTYLFHVGNAEDLAKQMKKVIEADKEILWVKCQKTAVHNENLLSLDNWCENIISIYSRV